MNNGFVKIPRAMIDISAWRANHPVLTPFEAYADLLQMAYYGREPQVRTFNREQVTLRAGQLVGSRRYMAERWGWTGYQVSKMISQWVKAGLLTTVQTKHNTIYAVTDAANLDEQTDDCQPTIQPTTRPTLRPTKTVENSLFTEDLEASTTENQPPLRPPLQPNNKKIVEENEQQSTKRERAQATKHQRQSPFFPPTREQVEAYCMQAGIRTVDASRFVDYYEANGWRVGSHPMRSWQATVRNWNRRAMPGSRTFLGSEASNVAIDQALSTEPRMVRLPGTLTTNLNPLHQHVNTSPIPTTITSNPSSSTGSTAGSTAAPRSTFPSIITKRTACAEALVSYQARQARRVASMDAEEPDF